MNIKLADFGFSNYFDLKTPLKTYCGSASYAAPELFMGKRYYGPEIDIWSMGVILYVLVSATLPFDSENLLHLKQRVLAAKFRIPYYMSQDCEDLITHILVANASKRLKLQQIKSHKWIKTHNASYYYYFNNNKNSLSLENSIEESSPSNGFLKVERDKFQSKSLKLVGNKQSRAAEQKKKLVLSSLSLPLYSFEDCFYDPVLDAVQTKESNPTDGFDSKPITVIRIILNSLLRLLMRLV